MAVTFKTQPKDDDMVEVSFGFSIEVLIECLGWEQTRENEQKVREAVKDFAGWADCTYDAVQEDIVSYLETE